MTQNANNITDYFASLPAIPKVDFSEFGEVEVQKLPRAQVIGASFLARNWAAIPHVTHHDEADITLLETRRKSLSLSESNTKVSMPILLIKAIVAALKEFPKFNASLSESGKEIVIKKFYNIGVAVDTPNGLLVPVIKDVDQKSLHQLADELQELATAARDKGLPMQKMEGGTFSLSSIGSLGGLGFTPIINAPEVAILGATKSYWKAERGPEGELVWALKLPLSLSYDHRVINGADAAKFVTYIGDVMKNAACILGEDETL